MLQYRKLLPLLVFGLCALPVWAQDKADLKWKFEKDKTIYQELTTETTQDMKVMGMDVKQKQKQTFYFSWKPTEQKDGKWIIKQRIDGVKMEIEIGGNKIAYDSEAPGAGNNPLADFFKELKGSEFTLTVGSDMKVEKVEGRADFLSRLGKSQQQMKPLLENILSEDALKQMADPSFAVVPNGEADKDKTWKYNSKLNLGPIGSYDTTYDYKYVGKDEKNKDLDKIAVTTTLKYSAPGSDTPGAGLPFKIKSASLEGKNGTGTVLFDAKAGRIDTSEMNLTLEGKLDIEIGGMATTVELKQTQKTTVKGSDTPQLKK
ncbi:MAG: hypothetical protein JNM56_27845 [Planctomycetia bacterium]|nr:hypothetical protein [Planctomycetia bacterium]